MWNSINHQMFALAILVVGELMMRAQQAEGISTYDYQIFKKLLLQHIRFFWVLLYLDTQSLSYNSINQATYV